MFLISRIGLTEAALVALNRDVDSKNERRNCLALHGHKYSDANDEASRDHIKGADLCSDILKTSKPQTSIGCGGSYGRSRFIDKTAFVTLPAERKRHITKNGKKYLSEEIRDFFLPVTYIRMPRFR